MKKFLIASVATACLMLSSHAMNPKDPNPKTIHFRFTNPTGYDFELLGAAAYQTTHIVAQIPADPENTILPGIAWDYADEKGHKRATFNLVIAGTGQPLFQINLEKYSQQINNTKKYFFKAQLLSVSGQIILDESIAPIQNNGSTVYLINVSLNEEDLDLSKIKVFTYMKQ